MTDPVALTAALVREPTVTPEPAGAFDILERALSAAGFRCARIPRGGVQNLFARWGDAAPVLGFNGHVDVVPVGDASAWTRDPFGAEIADGALWGRGAVDMKSGVAAFVAAAIDFVTETPPRGSVALLITGDEEGPSTDGTVAILDWMETAGERLDACVVGEPTSVETLGDAIKIGRRGSMSAFFEARGRQGHTAYPERALNPLPALMRLLDRLASTPLDAGSAHFGPSTLQIATVDVGNPANNVIPAAGRATVNIRFNDLHDSAALTARLRAESDAVAAAFGVEIAMETQVSGESFLTEPGPFVQGVVRAVEAAAGRTPALGAGGGTSDARFVKDLAPVVEVGLVGRGMHAVDERVPVADIEGLTAVYRAILSGFFAPGD